MNLDHLLSKLFQFYMDIIANTKDFLSLVQDASFIKMLNESKDPDKLLEELIQEHPKDKESIRLAFDFIQISRSDLTKMNPDDFDRILKNLQKYSGKKTSTRKFPLISIYLRIVAMVLIILSIGSVIVYYHLKKDPLSQFAQSFNAKDGQAIIVLSDGSTQVLSNNESLIDYKSKQGEIIVKNSNENERIGNHTDNKKAVLNQIVVPFGQRHQVLLSDGSVIHLNAGSKLTFPAEFSGKTRVVYLKGEGFFEVNNNPKLPFIVKTDHIDIKVLGTTFNVSAYDDENIVSTVLVEGKVNVSQKDKLLSNDEFVLSPGQGCFYSDVSGKSVVKNVDVNCYASWKDGFYIFKDVPLSEIVNRVHKYYNFSIYIEGDKLANTMISGKLVLSNDITSVMKYLARTVEGRYEKTAEGTFKLNQ